MQWCVDMWSWCQQPYLISIHLYFKHGLLDAIGAFTHPEDIKHLGSRALMRLDEAQQDSQLRARVRQAGPFNRSLFNLNEHLGGTRGYGDTGDTGARAKAWCLLIHAASSLYHYLSLRGTTNSDLTDRTTQVELKRKRLQGPADRCAPAKHLYTTPLFVACRMSRSNANVLSECVLSSRVYGRKLKSKAK